MAADVLDRRQAGKTADIAYDSARWEAELPEERITRRSEMAFKFALLRVALERANEKDRAVIVAFLQRNSSMPRSTSA
jgi:hypothetical protein